MKSFKVKPVINKKNNQINISLPRKKLNKEIRSKIDKIDSLKINIEGFDLLE